MRLVCPECNAAYEAPDELFAQSREVRCNRCGFQWTVMAPDAVAAPPVAEAPVDAQPATLPPPAAPATPRPAVPQAPASGPAPSFAPPVNRPEPNFPPPEAPVAAAASPAARMLFTDATAEAGPRGPDAEERLLSAELDYRDRPHRGGWLKLVLTLVVLLAILAALVLARTQIIALVPSVAGIYAAVGL